MADMSAERGVLLDVSRLISRLGGGPLTGIDRVELEWLSHLQSRPHLLLCRLAGGQALLPPAAGAALLRWSAGDLSDLPAPGFLARLTGRTSIVERAGAALRAMAIAFRRNRIGQIGQMAAAHLGADAAYLNLGHSNWRREVLAGVAPLRRVVLIHDVIPLDHPEFTRKGQSEKFRDRFVIAASLADLIVTISQASAERITLWRKRSAIAPRAPIVVVPIGTRLGAADPAQIPADLDLTRPFFVTLGTIEPRKNHVLLLDAWDRLARDHGPADLPQLFIIGRRGWENQETFARLDQLPAGSPVHELSGLGDGAVAALLAQSHALLMPSRAEGFGLPLTEAAGRGVPVLATPLPSTQELLGAGADYLDPDDPAAWSDAIWQLTQSPPRRLTPLQAPDWPSHFSGVEAALLHSQD